VKTCTYAQNSLRSRLYDFYEENKESGFPDKRLTYIISCLHHV